MLRRKLTMDEASDLTKVTKTYKKDEVIQTMVGSGFTFEYAEKLWIDLYGNVDSVTVTE